MNKEMKQYTGTKTVKAMPMTMGEAYERKLLKEGVRLSEVTAMLENGWKVIWCNVRMELH